MNTMKVVCLILLVVFTVSCGQTGKGGGVPDATLEAGHDTGQVCDCEPVKTCGSCPMTEEISGVATRGASVIGDLPCFANGGLLPTYQVWVLFEAEIDGEVHNVWAPFQTSLWLKQNGEMVLTGFPLDMVGILWNIVVKCSEPNQ